MAKKRNNNKNTSDGDNGKSNDVDGGGNDVNGSGPSSGGSSSSSSGSGSTNMLFRTLAMVVGGVYLAGVTQGFYKIFLEAYNIRMYAINEFGRLIHEFDPYFNYRATEYLWANGWYKFSHWFDTMVWYPLGRPVGTTIFPGMQVTSVAIKKFILPEWSINDICCFVPSWFGVLATGATALLTYECIGQGQFHPIKQQAKPGLDDEPYESIFRIIPFFYSKLIKPTVVTLFNYMDRYLGTTLGLRPRTTSTPGVECAFFAAAIMSIVPAHILRSVGGGYDNESVATTAMVTTFFCWTRTLRNTTYNNKDDDGIDNPTTIPKMTILWAIITAFAYFYMVAAWGGYTFVINLIGVHASVLVALGRFSNKLYWGYTVFYVLGTYLATRVPCVGLTPIKSLEQLGPCLTFIIYQVLQYVEVKLYRRKQSNSVYQRWKLRTLIAFSVFVFFFLLSWLILIPEGYFGPLSSRVRGLFVKHTKTGNPLVDSVAEHQAASTEAYFQYLNRVVNIAPVGGIIVALQYFNDSSSFLLVYAAAAYFFSHKMVRLILLTAPIASVLGGIALGYLWSWMVGSLFTNTPSVMGLCNTYILGDDNTEAEEQEQKKSKSKKGAKGTAAAKWDVANTAKHGDPILVRALRLAACYYVVTNSREYFEEFYKVSHDMARGMSHPTIVNKARTQDGREVLVDDYREAYFWLRDNTPEDARIMAWWDYGYQITGISNRTTIADGNTWNHEHIALLGRTLTAPEKEGHRIARHLADYILVWAGGGGDDLAKSPHLIRIANSVYRGLCSEPTCRGFGFYSNGVPSQQLERSMLYKLHSHGIKPEVEADRNRFKLVFHSKYGKVRIFKILKVSKESKEWVLNKENRLCDEGGWLCRGQYPPALRKVLAQKKDFAQLEDFNTDQSDEEYQRQYMENLMNKDGTSKDKKVKKKRQKGERLSLSDIERINAKQEDNQYTTMLWQIISGGQTSKLRELLEDSPELAHMRSEDGRGPMWWAYEYNRHSIVKLLKEHQVSDTRTDDSGVRAVDLA